MEKLKVKQYQICCSQTEYPPELHQSQTSMQFVSRYTFDWPG